MKATDNFKNIIKEYLDERSENDELFALKYASEKKNIDDCVTYILNTVQKSGCNGFADDEIFSMAVHYYDEENIEVGDAPNAKVVVNHSIELTVEEKEDARQKAIEQYQADALEKMKKKAAPKKKAEAVIEQPSLFDL